MNIQIKGLCGEVSHQDYLEEYHGLDCQDNFADYSNISKIKSGYLRFSYEEGELYSIVDIELSSELTEKESSDLIDEVSGQLSDGIGEGFEQVPQLEINGEEAYISPWYSGQKLKIIKI